VAAGLSSGQIGLATGKASHNYGAIFAVVNIGLRDLWANLYITKQITRWPEGKQTALNNSPYGVTVSKY